MTEHDESRQRESEHVHADRWDDQPAGTTDRGAQDPSARTGRPTDGGAGAGNQHASAHNRRGASQSLEHGSAGGHHGQPHSTHQQGPQPSGRFVSAIVGGVVAFVMGWIPFLGPMLGGIAGGYLRGSSTREGLLVGSLSGLLAAIPGLGLGAVFLLLGGIGVLLEPDGEMLLGWFLWAILILGAFLYMVVCGAIGGVIGQAISSRSAPQ